MGESTEHHSAKRGIARGRPGRLRRRSHQRAAAAQRTARSPRRSCRCRCRSGVARARERQQELRESQSPSARTRDSPGHHRRVAGQAASGLRCGRHDHRRHLVADLRRRLRGRGHEQGQGRGTRVDLAGRDRRPRQRGRARQLAALSAGQRHQARAKQVRPDGGRPGPDRDQRGVRLGRHRVDRASWAWTRRS